MNRSPGWTDERHPMWRVLEAMPQPEQGCASCQEGPSASAPVFRRCYLCNRLVHDSLACCLYTPHGVLCHPCGDFEEALAAQQEYEHPAYTPLAERFQNLP